jgi:hypothetical protein
MPRTELKHVSKVYSRSIECIRRAIKSHASIRRRRLCIQYYAGRRRTNLRTFWAPPLRKHSRHASRSPHYYSILNNHLECRVPLQCSPAICSRSSFAFDGGSADNFPSTRSHFGFSWMQVGIMSILYSTLQTTSILRHRSLVPASYTMRGPARGAC